MSRRLNKREVVEQDGVIGTIQGEIFSPESNFHIKDILQYVITSTQSGFLVKIETQAFESVCYFNLDDAATTKKFMKALNNSKTSRGLFCQLFDGELNKYVMQIADEFFQRNPEARQKPRIAVEKHGLQSDGKTWVLNETCQIDGDGNQLDETESTYIWMEDYLSSRSVQMFRSEVVVPLKKKSFSSLLKKLHSAVPGTNFVSAFCFIASGIMSMHYETIQKKFGQCPSPIAVGPNDTGKTTTAKAFLALVGNEEKGLARQMTEAEASLKCASSSIPYVFDDPDNLAEVKSLINNNFNGQVRSTAKSTHIPRTTCLITMNEDKLPRLLTNFREKSRVVLLPFPAVARLNDISKQMSYQQKLDKVKRKASRAIGLLISLGQEVQCNTKFLNDHCIPVIVECLGEVVGPRVLKNYFILMFFIRQLITLYPDACPKMEQIKEYFKNEVSRMCNKYQTLGPRQQELKDSSAHSLGMINSLAEGMVKSLAGETPSELLKHINPHVKSTALSGAKCYAIKRNAGFKFLEERGVVSPSKSAVEDLIKRNMLGELNVNKNFLKDGQEDTVIKNANSMKGRAVLFRRSLVQKELRESLDKLLNYNTPKDELDETVKRNTEKSIVCSDDNQWLIKESKVVAYGKVDNGHFLVTSPIVATINAGTKINLCEPGVSHCTFPAGTRVKVEVVEQNPDDASSEDEPNETPPGSDNESENDESTGSGSDESEKDTGSLHGGDKGLNDTTEKDDKGSDITDDEEDEIFGDKTPQECPETSAEKVYATRRRRAREVSSLIDPLTVPVYGKRQRRPVKKLDK